MITINNGSLSELIKSVKRGEFLRAEIISISKKGKLRVKCNWLYSSLNCDPDDTSEFLWSFHKIDDHRIALSPVKSCISETIYVSIRDDIDYYLQVQAPYSADWITDVGGDEKIGFKLHDFNIVEFKGFNGKYIRLNSDKSSHDGHKGYRLRSIGNDFDSHSQWILNIQKCVQKDVEFSGYSNDINGLKKQLENCNIKVDQSTLDVIEKNITVY